MAIGSSESVVTLLAAGDMSQATLTTSALNLSHLIAYSIQANMTGSPVGTMKLQASNDNVNFVDITGSSQAVNGAGTLMFNIGNQAVGYLYVVGVYTKTSGTGSLTVIGVAKGE